jgi:hypothetical protein
LSQVKKSEELPQTDPNPDNELESESALESQIWYLGGKIQVYGDNRCLF